MLQTTFIVIMATWSCGSPALPAKNTTADYTSDIGTTSVSAAAPVFLIDPKVTTLFYPPQTCGLLHGHETWTIQGEFELSLTNVSLKDLMIEIRPLKLVKHWSFNLSQCQEQTPPATGSFQFCTNSTLPGDQKQLYYFYLRQIAEEALSEQSISILFMSENINKVEYEHGITRKLPFVYKALKAIVTLSGVGYNVGAILSSNKETVMNVSALTQPMLQFCVRNSLSPYSLTIKGNPSIENQCVSQTINMDKCESFLLSYEERTGCYRKRSFPLRIGFSDVTCQGVKFHFRSGIKNDSKTCASKDGVDSWSAEGTLVVLDLERFIPEVIMLAEPSGKEWKFKLKECTGQHKAVGSTHSCSNKTIEPKKQQYDLFIYQIADQALSEENLTVWLYPKDPKKSVQTKYLGKLPLIQGLIKCSYQLTGSSKRNLSAARTEIVVPDRLIDMKLCCTNLKEPFAMSISGTVLSTDKGCLPYNDEVAEGSQLELELAYSENNTCQRRDSFVIRIVVKEKTELKWYYFFAIILPMMVVLVGYIFYIRKKKKEKEMKEQEAKFARPPVAPRQVSSHGSVAQSKSSKNQSSKQPTGSKQSANVAFTSSSSDSTSTSGKTAATEDSQDARDAPKPQKNQAWFNLRRVSHVSLPSFGQKKAMQNVPGRKEPLQKKNPNTSDSSTPTTESEKPAQSKGNKAGPGVLRRVSHVPHIAVRRPSIGFLHRRPSISPEDYVRSQSRQDLRQSQGRRSATPQSRKQSPDRRQPAGAKGRRK